MRLSTARRFRVLIPPTLRPAGRAIAVKLFPSLFKYQHELNYWDVEWDAGRFENEYYERMMLALADKPNTSFLAGKICADFGCGPMGSLCWATPARARIGIDVMADAYSRYGIKNHDMVYVASTERKVPLPSSYVDVLFTMNALDHVNYFELICDELIRILAPGGLFFGSFNLGEPPTFSEPQTLSEEKLQQSLLRHFDIESYRRAAWGPPGNVYKYFYEEGDPPLDGIGCLWVRARKRA